MSLTTARDINVTITVPNSSENTTNTTTNLLVRTERRITPSWTIGQLKSKLEPITGIPASQQDIRHYNSLTDTLIPLTPDTALVGDSAFGIRKDSELSVLDLRPPGARQNFTDVSGVEKYEMPVEHYERLDDTVLAWKRKQKLGRFDPNAKSPEEMADERRAGDQEAVERKGIVVGKRCRVGGEDERRGEVKFVGEIEGLGGLKEKGCVWVGVELDEPVGRNNGSAKVEGADGKIEVKQVFRCKEKFGVFARPEKVETGEFPPLDDFDADMEEL